MGDWCDYRVGKYPARHTVVPWGYTVIIQKGYRLGEELLHFGDKGVVLDEGAWARPLPDAQRLLRAARAN